MPADWSETAYRAKRALDREDVAKLLRGLDLPLISPGQPIDDLLHDLPLARWNWALILETVSGGRVFVPEQPFLTTAILSAGRRDVAPETALPMAMDQFFLDDSPFPSKLPHLPWPELESLLYLTVDHLPEEPHRADQLIRLLLRKTGANLLADDSLTRLQRLLFDRRARRLFTK